MNGAAKVVNDQSSIVFGIISIALGFCTFIATLLTLLLLPCGIVQIFLGAAGIITGLLAFTRGKKANVPPGKLTGLIGTILSSIAILIPIGYFIFIVVLYLGLFSMSSGSR
ncbi:MAG: hypothetical protein AB7V18_00875 [Pyrinomonadaceae bacterium]